MKDQIKRRRVILIRDYVYSSLRRRKGGRRAVSDDNHVCFHFFPGCHLGTPLTHLHVQRGLTTEHDPIMSLMFPVVMQKLLAFIILT